MKRNVAKWIISVVFVAVAGIGYLCAAKTPGTEDDASIILQREAGTLPGEEISRSTENLLSAAGVAASLKIGSPDSDTGGDAELIYVHVCGAVNEPGVYALPAGSRAADAVHCAGDFLPGAAKDYLNLAARIWDGQKIYVPNEAEAERFREEGVPADLQGFMQPDSADFQGGEHSYGDSQSGAGQVSSCVNLNTAGVDELMTLPGIGRTKADAILAYRSEHGAFSSCEELMQVPGIKESIYEKLCGFIAVGK